MALVEPRACNHHGSIHSTHSAHWSTSPGHVSLYDASPRPSSSPEAVHSLSATLNGFDLKDLDPRGERDESRALNFGLKKEKPTKQSSASSTDARSLTDVYEPRATVTLPSRVNHEKRSFHRWMRSLRRRAMHRSSTQSIASSVAADSQSLRLTYQEPGIYTSRHRKMSSDSSLAFVTAVRSASVSLASMSAVARSKRTHPRSLARSRTDRSSRASFAGHRISEDSALQEQSLVPDIAAVQRAAQRRRILEELISTEESYIGDLRFLMNVSFTAIDLAHESNDIPGIYHHPRLDADPTSWPANVDQSQPSRDSTTA